MINTRKRCISLPLIAFCVLLILSGCDTPGGFDDPEEGYGVITVSIDDEFARTIYPLVEFARYDYFFAKVIKGKTQNFEKQVPVEGVFTLELGDWQVRVNVYATEDDPYPAATGTSVIFNVSREGIKQVKIQLTGNEKSGYGSFSYYIEYPAGTTIDTFELKPYPPTPENIIIDLLPASNSGIRTNIPAGCYSITIFLSNAEGKAGASDAVYILEKLESAYGTAAKPIVFTERNFIKPIGTPAASDFTFGNMAQVAGTGVQPVTVTPRDGKSTGAITILYDGSQTLPTAVGTYAVTFNVAASPNWWAEYNLSAGTLALVDPNNVFNVANETQWNTAVSTINTRGADLYLINVTNGFSMNGVTSATFTPTGINVFINGNSHEISLSSGGSLLRIGDNQAVTMNDLTLKGDSNNVWSLVYVEGGTFNMNSGAISGNTVSGVGGGVNVNSSGTFNMNGGTISDNTAKNGYGGGVCVSNALFIMNGGTISDNTANNGGGVRVGNASTHTTFFIMNGGTISDNTATDGGGVYVNTGSTFTMNGGAISRNTAIYCGGVFVTSGGEFTMIGGTISYNKAASEGGGVYVNTVSTFTMNGGAISGNAATDSGGGVIVYDRSTFTMNSGTISDNKSGSSGGGVLVTGSNNTFIMNGGAISGNTASNGGGVYSSGTFTMNGGTISGNTANSWGGGGVLVSSGTFIMNGGAVSGNTASNGGGVLMDDNATFQITSGTVYGSNETNTRLRNTAANGAALYKNGTAEYGNGATWTDIPLNSGSTTARDATIRVVDGVLR